VTGGWWLVVGGWWLVVGGWWLVAGGWWLVVGGWWLVITAGAGLDGFRDANFANLIMGISAARPRGPLKSLTRPETTHLLRVVRKLLTPGLMFLVSPSGSLWWRWKPPEALQQRQTIRAIRVPKAMGSPGGTSLDSCGDANAAKRANRIDSQRERLTPTRLIFSGSASGSL
jgi:hypothetical protein